MTTKPKSKKAAPKFSAIVMMSQEIPEDRQKLVTDTLTPVLQRLLVELPKWVDDYEQKHKGTNQ